ncbi:tRNA uridine-5-carboxymethylaminomethyl(34) synthesis GTPase MnmE [Hahella aquimaris]|uniref:tRNA uridine-5-carboxymethylaminomethyl(34) synthesis GTPase MnmE n=1 Tax=Hahella sp. HNIBRBA332 TaxID=3015983 RepID=UPI00273BBCA8|nr:tRNA uridine-5-carboxymethylaminomethyl(34) synthesis GTPase MnmE [Hahella sp. HNIBRBA332]WLQ13064.1 tRNA uridine-5-carboxymethylaminomethyl(34) synthesis GTPase MnmE [Hahella sp. HNIBRBA332]
MYAENDTIVAIATPPGKGGVGVVRVSGPQAKALARLVLGYDPKPRHAHYGPFFAEEGDVLDSGIALLFTAPNSFTGEDVIEFQGHGGPVVLDLLVKHLVAAGARLARPGEFSERAFMNDKLDLVQAEAIADLIEATSEQAAHSAMRSLQGQFSKEIEKLIESLIQLRIYVEAAIDFPEEEIDFLSDGKVLNDLDTLLNQTQSVFASAKQGALMREGMTVVIAGRPNAGKSSLLNALAGKESAIVTEIEGTTRDVLREHIHIDGMPLHIVDTAGLRDSDDVVEKIGIERAWKEIDRADRILFLVDAMQTKEVSPERIWPEFYARIEHHDHITVVRNKIDLSDEPQGIDLSLPHPVIRLSAKGGQGIDHLREHLKACVGFESHTEGSFMARRRHLEALTNAEKHIQLAKNQLLSANAGELVAEDLRVAQNALSEITGAFTSDDLLGRIFSSFCIGK